MLCIKLYSRKLKSYDNGLLSVEKNFSIVLRNFNRLTVLMMDTDPSFLGPKSDGVFWHRSMDRHDLVAMMSIEQQCYTTPWTAQHFLQELEQPGAFIVVCGTGEQITGYLCYRSIVDEMEILNVATAPDFQRQGVADRLMRHVLHHASKLGVGQVFLEVRISNLTAIRLYQRFGFVQNGVRQRYYADHEDALLMTRKLVADGGME
ncbi:MAG: ribosomal-protein-alanine N-acetyltransferase [Desulfuromonas sp.]|nr:MAG: ribosomal-protein-alanine N-acetyltransferase [Desulfuromonas sp.]